MSPNSESIDRSKSPSLGDNSIPASPFAKSLEEGNVAPQPEAEEPSKKSKSPVDDLPFAIVPEEMKAVEECNAHLPEDHPVAAQKSDSNSQPVPASTPAQAADSDISGNTIPNPFSDAPKPSSSEPNPSPNTVVETVASSAFGTESNPIKQLELRAIFGVNRELSHEEILQRAKALPGIRQLAQIEEKELSAVDALQQIFSKHGFSSPLKIYTGNSAIEWIRVGDVLLAVETEAGFAPGVRETLMIVARELGH